MDKNGPVHSFSFAIIIVPFEALFCGYPIIIAGARGMSMKERRIKRACAQINRARPFVYVILSSSHALIRNGGHAGFAVMS